MNRLLETYGNIILDGGLGSELDRRGIAVGDSDLWSAELVISNPTILKQIHQEYLKAGADIVTSASYQGSVAGFKKYLKKQQASSNIKDDELEQQALDLIQKSVQVAIDARDEFWTEYLKDNKADNTSTQPRGKPLVAASVGPYGAFLAQGEEYTGDYKFTSEEQGQVVLNDFHRPRLQAMLLAKPEVLAIETIPNAQELTVILDILSGEYLKSVKDNAPFPDTFLAFSINTGDYISLADGTPLDSPVVLGKILEINNKSQHQKQLISAVGVNCLPLEKSAISLEFLHEYFNAQGVPDFPLVVYPNSGEVYDGINKIWLAPAKDENGDGTSNGNFDENSPPVTTLATGAKKWSLLGAKLIGGCCRTRPNDITDLRRAIFDRN